MKIFFTLIILFNLTISLSQNEIGKSYADIKDKYQSAEYKLSEKKEEDMLDRITIELSNAKVIFLFDVWTKTCNAQMIYPNTEADLNNLIKEYNESFISKSYQMWVRYFEGFYQEIHLEYSETSKEYFFIWRIPQKVTNND